jgi:amino acid exporter
MSHYTSGTIVAFGAFALALLSPGPNMMAVVHTSMAAGRRAGLAVAAGVSLGSLWWVLLSAAGVVSLIGRYRTVFVLIEILGAIYLLFLAWRSLRSSIAPSRLEPPEIGLATTNLTYFGRGLLIQVTNPKSAMTWVAILALAIDPSMPRGNVAALIAGVILLSLAAYIAYALLFSSRNVVSAYLGVRRWIDIGLGIFFCVASYRLMANAFSG